MTKREIVGRYRGSALGLLWSFFNPVLMLIIYTFVFSVIFQAKWGEQIGQSKAEFALILFVGLMIFNIFSECINRAPGLILNNVNYVKKIVFPLDILPWINLLAALFHALMSFIVWLIFSFYVFGIPPVTIFFIPIVIFPFILFIMGCSWLLASLGVYLRDVSQVVGVLTAAMMFLSPIFYPITAIPEEYRHYIYANPLTFVIEQARSIMIYGQYPDWQQIGVVTFIMLIVFLTGFAWFQRTRKGFADVL